jgi:hypothetical protein
VITAVDLIQSHTHTHTHTLHRTPLDNGSVRRRVSTCTTQNIHKEHTSMLLAVFELLVPATEGPQNLHLRPCSQLDRPLWVIIRKKVFKFKVRRRFTEVLQVYGHSLYAVTFSFELVCVCLCVSCRCCVAVCVCVCVCVCFCVSVLDTVFLVRLFLSLHLNTYTRFYHNMHKLNMIITCSTN